MKVAPFWIEAGQSYIDIPSFYTGITLSSTISGISHGVKEILTFSELVLWIELFP